MGLAGVEGGFFCMRLMHAIGRHSQNLAHMEAVVHLLQRCLYKREWGLPL